MAHQPDIPASDLFIIGGGINGCGIARDAAGRGLSVRLAEMGDLGGATSSSSTKLFHGGLRYLEYFEFRLVREALIERETLLRAMPHISWPMRFVLPCSPGMRVDQTTPAARLLGRLWPGMAGRRPAWMIRLGLFLYDTLGGRQILPGTTTLRLDGTPEGAALKPGFRKALEYSDCWVDDARLVILNARDAAARGAEILPRTRVLSARREGALWRIETQDQDSGACATHHARMLVNAAGPWAGAVMRGAMAQPTEARVRLVRGGHIVTRRLFDHDKAYFLQGQDGRIIFAIPYERDFTLIGTTDAEHADPAQTPRITPEETRYLLDFANGYLRTPLTEADILWSYSGVRPLYDDGAENASAATRDYVLKLDTGTGAPALHVFGGKITTYRRLAEAALDRIATHLPIRKPAWTAGAALPGGDFPVDGVADLTARLRSDYPFLTAPWASRLIRAYGTEAWAVLGDARSTTDLGRDFGATLTEAELRWMQEREFARSAEDVLWRRSKLGLRLTQAQAAAVADWMNSARDRTDIAAE